MFMYECLYVYVRFKKIIKKHYTCTCIISSVLLACTPVKGGNSSNCCIA